jgi:uncharacterized OsmC-like protein
LGTFAGALAARKIEVDNGKVRAHARGEVENEGGTLIIRRIHVLLKLEAPESAREIVSRVHEVYASKCPIYRSLIPAIQITTSYELTDAQAV